MANTTTALNLWDRALDYADMTGSSFPDVNRKFNLINAAVSALHYAIVNSGSEYVVGTPATVNVVAGTATYALPTDFYKLLKVYRKEGNRRYAVRSYTREMAEGLLHVPSTSAVWEVHYIPHAVLLTADGNVIETQYPPGWEDYCAMHIAVRLLIKEESLEAAAALTQERDALLAQIIKAYGGPRDLAEPSVVADAYGRYSDPWRHIIDAPAGAQHYYRVEGANLRVVEADPAGHL